MNCTNGEDVAPLTFDSTTGYPVYGTNGAGEPYSFHPGGMNVLLGDASVRWVNENVDIRIFAAAVTRSGQESYQLPN